MKEPKVEVKNVKFHNGHEGYGVNADVLINGVKVYHVLDDGNGGCLRIDLLVYGSKNPDLIRKLAKELNDYIGSLPAKPMNFGHGDIKDEQGNVRMFKTTLEDYINELLFAYERDKSRKKMEKQMEDCILFGVPNGETYVRIKFNSPLRAIPTLALQQRVNKILREECVGGVQILNTNLAALGIQI